MPDLVLFIVRRQLIRPFLVLGLVLASAAMVHFLLPGDPMCRVCALISAVLWGGAIFVMLYVLQLAGQLLWLVLRDGHAAFAEHTVELREHAVVGSKAGARSEAHWSGVSGISVTVQRVFLDTGSSFVFCIPMRAFASPGDFDAFVECARKFRAAVRAAG